MPAKKPQLSPKQTKLVKGIAEGKTRRQAGIEAGYGTNPESTSAIVSEALKNPNVQEALQIELRKQGISIEQVVAPVAKALTATVKVPLNGKIVDTGEPDVELQLKGHDRAMKILNVGNKPETEGDFHIHLHQAEQRQKYDL